MRLLAILSSLALGACTVIGVRSGTEEPRFELVDRHGPLEIRAYGPRLAAETAVRSGAEEAARSEGFRRLAGFIFGANTSAAKIAMTAPVGQASERIAMTTPVGGSRDGGGRWVIRFFMPAAFTRETLPVPTDPQVAIVEVPGETVAVLRYSGVPSPAAAAEQRQALLAALAGSAWRATGEAGDWFYDPPWTLPPLRRNEAVVPVARR